METRFIDTYTGETYILKIESEKLTLSKSGTGQSAEQRVYALLDPVSDEIYTLQVLNGELHLVEMPLNTSDYTPWGVSDEKGILYVLEVSASKLSYRKATIAETIEIEKQESNVFTNRRMLDYLPLFIQEYAEIQKIIYAEEVEAIRAWIAAENVMKDQFVQDSTENGVKRWESILKLTPKGTYSLDERKFNIIARLNEQLPFTIEVLKRTLTNMCGENGYTLKLDHNKYLLSIKLSLTNENNIEAVELLLKRMVPANIITNVSLFNTHAIVGGFTHAQLAAYTHKQVREENLNN